MKKFIIVASAITLFSCAGQQEVARRDLIKVSEFSIVTPAKDTLYLKSGDEMAEHIRQNWDNGEFRKFEEGVYTHVVMVDEIQFNSLSKKCSSNNGSERGLSHLGNSY